MTPVAVAEVRKRARAAFERGYRDWAAYGDADAVLTVALHPPTEREVLADQDAAVAWVRRWREAASTDRALVVEWAVRNWASVGRQDVPERCRVFGAGAIAAVAGAAERRGWLRLVERVARLRAVADRVAPERAVPDRAAIDAAVRHDARTLRDLDDGDFDILVAVLVWLCEHPVAGMRIRQLPIRGIDTKWLERHRSVVENLHTALTGRSGLGLVAAPELVRIRFLDPALRPGGLQDVVAPVTELAALPVRPRVVFVFENLETVLAMPPMEGVVVAHGSGYAAGRLGAIDWIRDARILYWGDLDADGFAILNTLRSHCHDVTSLLMDQPTLVAHRDLWVPDPHPVAGEYPHLTDAERAVRAQLHLEGDVRLEQERVDWAVALHAITEAMSI